METADRRRSDDRKRMILRAISVAWPAMAESFFVTLAGMIDTMMVSALGSYAVAAVGLTNQPKFSALTLFSASISRYLPWWPGARGNSGGKAPMRSC